jgi:CRP-like cAMP-binding protein
VAATPVSPIAQNTACNRRHSVEERLARWLLLTQDRVHEPRFAMTQESMSQMLGVSRPTVSMTASILQKAGFITAGPDHRHRPARPSVGVV